MHQTNVVCVLKTSKEYGPAEVQELRDGVGKFLGDHTFTCLSDVEVPCARIPLKYNWPFWWAKMELFRPEVKGDILYFDLDTVIVGDLSDIASVNRLTMLSDFHLPQFCASGVMFIPAEMRPPIWEKWIANPSQHIQSLKGGDQRFLRDFWNDCDRWQKVLPGQIVSYKVHVQDKGVPDNARVVCFHGQPKPRDVERFW